MSKARKELTQPPAKRADWADPWFPTVEVIISGEGQGDIRGISIAELRRKAGLHKVSSLLASSINRGGVGDYGYSAG